MKNETTTVVLGHGPETETVTTIFSKGEVSSTDSFHPEGAEMEAENNPVPVAGYADSPEGTVLSTQLPEPALAETPSGRFLFHPEIVFPPDDRVRVEKTSAWPYSVHGHMIMRFPNGQVYIGSGTMVNRHHVLTAGHCVFSQEDGGWATSIQFNAGQDENLLPFGSAMAVRLLSVRGWTEDQDSAWDMGMLILDRELGQQTGWFGLATFDSANKLLNKQVNVTGYPGDKGGEQMWTHADVIKSVTDDRFFYTIDTMGGQSGSGVWSVFAGHQGEKVAGIHTTGSASGNGATRLSRAKFDRIVSWFQQY
ncbi:MAG: trypsin-like peptidase domain-containing protein [Caldilineaceae bacterium]